MIRQAIEDRELSARLSQYEADGLSIFTLGRKDGPEGGEVRGALVSTSGIVNGMRANHYLGILETLILGQAYTAALLMASGLKEKDRIGLSLSCDGPAQGFSVEARQLEDLRINTEPGAAAPSTASPASGGSAASAIGQTPGPGRGSTPSAALPLSPALAVRGYLLEDHIPIAAPLESLDTAPFIGTGSLTVTKLLEGFTQPFTGSVPIKTGRLAEDLSAYYLESEQTRSAVSLSVKFDKQGRVIGSGGLIVQAMPGADPGFIGRVEAALLGSGSLGRRIASGAKRAEILASVFGPGDSMGLVLRGTRPAVFDCPCDKHSMRGVLAASDMALLDDLAAHGPFPVQLLCHNCGSTYDFSREEVNAIAAERRRGTD